MFLKWYCKKSILKGIHQLFFLGFLCFVFFKYMLSTLLNYAMAVTLHLLRNMQVSNTLKVVFNIVVSTVHMRTLNESKCDVYF